MEYKTLSELDKKKAGGNISDGNYGSTQSYECSCDCNCFCNCDCTPIPLLPTLEKELKISEEEMISAA